MAPTCYVIDGWNPRMGVQGTNNLVSDVEEPYPVAPSIAANLVLGQIEGMFGAFGARA
ncbi:MAG: hypothetical protein WDN24_13340 [Sphingomonas sp.]